MALLKYMTMTQAIEFASTVDYPFHALVDGVPTTFCPEFFGQNDHWIVLQGREDSYHLEAGELTAIDPNDALVACIASGWSPSDIELLEE